MMKKIRIGSRESKLAIVQTGLVINEVKKKHPYLKFEIVLIKTKGDIILDQSLDKIGGKGLFIKELENALLEGSIDMAVHSMKDMPAEIPEGLAISAVSKREDPRDVLVTVDGKMLEQLKKGSIVGTSSIRREVQLREQRPDIRFKPLRGNVVTRLNKLQNKEYDAIILAAAGLKRLGMEDRCVCSFDTGFMIPAVGQGILGIETRKDYDIGFLLDSINCEEAAFQLAAERAFMIKLNGGCSIPLAANAAIDGELMRVTGMFVHQGSLLRASIEGNKYNAVILGEKLADIIFRKMEGLNEKG